MLSTDKERRKALDTLPKDLFDTYKRILNRLSGSNESNKRLVKRTLIWIMYAKQPLFLESIAKAITVKPGSDHLDPDDIPDEDSILKWCSSLIRKDDKTGILSFSHFTVEEFLTDSKLRQDSELSDFYIDGDSTGLQQVMASICLTYLNFTKFAEWNLTDWEETEKDVDRDPFLEYAAVFWHRHLCQMDDTCLDLLRRLFAPMKSNNYILWLQIYWPNRARGEAVPKAASTLHLAASLGIEELCEWLLDQKVDINAQDPVLGTALLCAIKGLVLFSQLPSFPTP
jgi:hypothetical protein